METFNFVLPSLGMEGYAKDIISQAANQTQQSSVIPLAINNLSAMNQNLVNEVGSANTYDMGVVSNAASKAYANTSPILNNTTDALTAVGERLASIQQEDANTAQNMASNATVSSGGGK